MNSSPAIAYGCVYVGAEDNNVYCLNATTGGKVWQSATGYWVTSSPAVADGNVYVGSEDHCIYCFDAFTGAKKWSYETGNFIESSPTVVNGTLYVGSDDFNIYAFTLCDSTIGNLPMQDSSGLNWSTVAFDVIAFATLAAIICAVVLVIRKDKKEKQTNQAQNMPSQQSWLSRHTDAVCILALVAFSIVFFINLGDGPLWAADEQTYSQWAFHMTKTGDYLTPWAYGEMTFWIAKPPLYMWLMSLSYQAFGVSNVSARLVSSIFGILTLIVVFYLGKALFNRKVGFNAALVLGTFMTFFSFARHAMTDVPFVFFIVSSIYFFVLSQKDEAKVNRYAALSGVFFGLALMTKQIQAFLLPLIIVVYLVLTQKSLKGPIHKTL